MITIVGASHPGCRKYNEDSFTADTELGLGLVADGMGGYACGEVASELVKTTVEDAIADNHNLSEGIWRAHAAVRDAAMRDPDKQGMGSTVIAVKVQQNSYDLAWVGDSRAYLWDAHNTDTPSLKQITRDHSYVESLLASGAINYQQALEHPERNLITQAIGIDNFDGLEIDEVSGSLRAGQQLLLCSDGLVDDVFDGDIASIMQAANSPAEAVDQLVNAAVDAGGNDNITVVIVSASEDQGDGQSAVPVSEPEVIRTTFPGGETLLGDIKPLHKVPAVDETIADDRVTDSSELEESAELSTTGTDMPGDQPESDNSAVADRKPFLAVFVSNNMGLITTVVVTVMALLCVLMYISLA